MLRLPTRGAAGILALGLAAATLAACSDDDPRDDATRLEVAWTSDVQGWNGDEAPFAANDDIWIYRDYEGGEVVGVGLDDGQVAWSHPLGEVCAFSEINEAGLVAVQRGADCSDLTVLDAASGEAAWDAALQFPGDTHPTDRGLSLGITEQTVTVAGQCGIERWSITGRVLPRLGVETPRPDRHCAYSATSGEVVLLADRSGLVGYDADTGERLWLRRGRDAEVQRIYSADPLVADVELAGVRAVRTIDPATGSLGPILGRRLSTIGPSPAIADPVGQTVVGAYDDPPGGFEPLYSSVLRGWDVETGEERWTRLSTGDDYLGGDETGVYLGRSIPATEDGEGPAYWVMRWRPGDTEPQTVGWVDDQVLDMVRVGGLLVTGASFGDPTTAYRLPEETEDLPIPPGEDSYVEPEWGEGDLRVDPLVDPCTLVSAGTLRTLGLDKTADLPAPWGCAWIEGDRTVSVQVTVSRPDDERSATEVAQEHIAERRATASYEEVDDPGLGDEVWHWRAASVGVTQYDQFPGSTSTNAGLLVRRANVVVEVGYREVEPGWTDGRIPLPISGARVQDGMRSAVEEALSAWDVPVAVPPAAVDGRVTRTPPPCAVLAGAVRAVLPGARPVDTSAPDEKRLRGCRWQARRYGDFVAVTAYAVGPNTITGADAESEARAIVDADGESWSARPVRGPWDEGSATVENHSYDDVARLVVRSDNLVLVVQVYRESGRGSLAAAVGLARDYVARA